MWRELLPAGSSRAYQAEPPLAPGIIVHFKLDDYRTFQESSRWLHQQSWYTCAVCSFPSRKSSCYRLCGLKPADQSEWKKYIGDSCYINRKHPYSTNSSAENPQLLMGFQDTGIGFPSLLLSGSQKQSDKQLKVQPIHSPKLFWLRGDSSSPVKHDCTS